MGRQVLRIGHFYRDYLDTGGVPSDCRALTGAIAALGHHVIVYAFGGREAGGERVPPGVTVRKYHETRRSPFAIPGDMREALETNADRLDLLNLHGAFIPAIVGAFHAASAGGIPCCVIPNGQLMQIDFLRQGRLKKALYARLVLRGLLARSFVHALSPTEARLLSRFAPEDQVFVAPYGLLVDPPAELRPSVLEELCPAVQGKARLVCLGRLERPLKGLDALVEAMAILSRSTSVDPVLVLMGPDWRGGRRELESLVRRRRLSGRVFFTGPVREEDKLHALAGADLFVMPSLWEGFPRSAREALSVGCPVLVTEGTNIAEWVLRYRAGAVVRSEPGSIAREALRLLEDRKGLAAMRGNALALARREFGWEVIAASVCESLSGLLAARHQEARGERGIP
jgi:glycosyltransferase involved in cell wall biosynthesis